MLAQIWQAGTSFFLQILVARWLGASGLAVFSLCLGVIVVASAVNGGVVGDSLTVLARRDCLIRGGLNGWLWIVSLTGALISGVTLNATGFLSAGEAWVFATAVILFAVEDTLRRVHIALMRFANLLIIDTLALMGTVVTVTVSWLAGHISLGWFLAPWPSGRPWV